MTHRRDKVFTIHGISTSGSWQEKISVVLEPHFDCKHIKYDQYRRLGPLKVFLALRVCIGAAIIAAGARILNYVSTRASISFALAGLILALWAGFRRRNQLLLNIKAKIDTHRRVGERPHVIAHSFGTFIIGH